MKQYDLQFSHPQKVVGTNIGQLLKRDVKKAKEMDRRLFHDKTA